jgi:hypothetical protein
MRADADNVGADSTAPGAVADSAGGCCDRLMKAHRLKPAQARAACLLHARRTNKEIANTLEWSMYGQNRPIQRHHQTVYTAADARGCAPAEQLHSGHSPDVTAYVLRLQPCAEGDLARRHSCPVGTAASRKRTAFTNTAHKMQRVLLATTCGLLTACGDHQPPDPSDVPSTEFREAHAFTFANGSPVLRAVDAAFTPAGGVLVLDQLAPGVHEFDSAGSFIRTLGDKGAGPGELLYPTTIAVSPTSGTLAISDERLGRVVIWDSDGTEVRTFNRSTHGTGTIAWGRADRLLVRSMKAVSGAPTLVLEELNVETGTARDFVRTKGSPRDMLAGGKSKDGVCLMCPIAISSDGVFAQALDPRSEYRVTLLSADSALTTVSIFKDAVPLARTAAQKETVKRQLDDLPPYLRPFLRPLHRSPFISGLVFDERGYLWVQVPTPDGGLVEIYDHHGSLVEVIRFSDSVQVKAATTDRVLGVVIDTATHVFQVKRYDRVRHGP